MSLDALKAMRDALKKEKKEVAGDKKYVTKAELEAARLKKIREEEERERQEKERKRKLQHGEDADTPAKQAKTTAEQEEGMLPQLPREEVIRRLRKLGQPATLFGEEDYERLKRLMKAEKEMNVEDETVGGQQDNVLLELKKLDKEERARRKAAASSAPSGKGAGAGDGKGENEGDAGKKSGAGGEAGKDGDGAGAVATPEPEDPTLVAFKKAAAALAEKRAEESMSVEERIEKWVKRWMKEWEDDLERRPDDIKNSGSGHQTTLTFRQTVKYLEPLYNHLHSTSLHDELRTGLWMMVQAMRDRNYLYANDIYLKLAIGNSPWPIGVTQVGIHERSAREKISHVMNQSGIAHIMNDEATRKYLQAMKRLITFMQRAYPTDPSRSINFQTNADLGRGVLGGGSDKSALLEAEARGEDWRQLGLPEAPHFIEHDGSVKVPTKWQYILARATDAIGGPNHNGGSREASPAPGEAARPDAAKAK